MFPSQTEELNIGIIATTSYAEGAWQVLSLDFIEGLTNFERYNCILVVVDKFSKYAHFVPLTHPFTAESVATAFMKNIYKLHGMPKVIISIGIRYLLVSFGSTCSLNQAQICT